MPRWALFDCILEGDRGGQWALGGAEDRDNLRRVEEGVHVAERGTLAEFADTLRR